MYDVGGKLLNSIKSIYVNILDCVRVKGGASEAFRIDSDVRHGCIMSHWGFQCIYGCSDERGENGVEEEGREWRLLGLLYEFDLVFM